MHLQPFKEANHIKTSSLSSYHVNTTYLSFRKTPDPKEFKDQREKCIVLFQPPEHQREDIKLNALTFLSFRKPPDPKYNDLMIEK